MSAALSKICGVFGLSWLAKVVESCDFRADVVGEERTSRGEWEEKHEREQAGTEYKRSVVIPMCEYATVKLVAENLNRHSPWL